MEPKINSSISEYIGQKFGEWTVIGFSRICKGVEYWKVQCGCGYITNQRKPYILNGRSGSCKTCAMRKFRTGEEITCDYCGSTVYRSMAQLSRGKQGNHFCSRECARSYYSRVTRLDTNTVCSFCGKEFHSSLSTKRKYCSRSCWKLGIQSSGPIYYRKFKGDICNKCGFVPVDKCQLDIHHIDNNKNNNKEDNLITLCANCHRLVHFLDETLGKTGGACEV